jgi:hypothetical protein
MRSTVDTVIEHEGIADFESESAKSDEGASYPEPSLFDRKGESREPLTKPVELPQGILEMFILKAVSLGSLHGYGILLRIQQISGERLGTLQGSFYTAIYRLEHRGWIKGKFGSRKTIVVSLLLAHRCRYAPAQDRDRQMDRHARGRRQHSRQEDGRDMSLLATIRKLWHSTSPLQRNDPISRTTTMALTLDGVHPSPQGYALITLLVEQAI